MQAVPLMTMGPSSIMSRFTIAAADLTAAGTTQTIALRSLAKGTIIKGVRIKHSTAFAGGGNTAVTVSVGSTAGSSTLFAAAFDVFQTVADTTMLLVSEWKAATYAADTLNAYFTVTTGVCSGITAGEVHIDVEYQFTDDLTACGPAGNQTTGGGGLI